ncbi:MAG TPA: transcriptional regulator [Spirochaetota bacterium]|nr:transcriptional regulator [Spirochaetota bacterium]HOD15537.1 transcriptional regulator [Spirochaetota bacterium]HPG49625.1 transcriptional regulator [Spirochaetota bacterium]HPN13491.1 transcriptional regulator [Spirochaetota bacterium]
MTKLQMKLRDAIILLDAVVYSSRDERLDAEILTARASDLMSEVLAEDAAPDILLTGLCNAQVIRTASVFGIKAVVFVRGIIPEKKIIDLAIDENVVIMTTTHSLFVSSGLLFAGGVHGTPRNN